MKKKKKKEVMEMIKEKVMDKEDRQKYLAYVQLMFIKNRIEWMKL